MLQCDVNFLIVSSINTVVGTMTYDSWKLMSDRDENPDPYERPTCQECGGTGKQRIIEIKYTNNREWRVPSYHPHWPCLACNGSGEEPTEEEIAELMEEQWQEALRWEREP